ncbi:MAG: hypothetical protein MUO30_08955 [Anaerolineales bacterium]|nr:hypothetical protein [Anaerolineales bacterium]
MIIEKVPAVVAALAEKVKMTPIAWKITPDEVVIVFEQGPLMTFNRDQVLDAVNPVIHNMEEAISFAKIGKVNSLPKSKPRSRRSSIK